MGTALLLIGFLVVDTLARGISAILAEILREVAYEQERAKLEQRTRIGF